ncbi:MAG: fluoride efflux transporter CrcB [Gammaproteobacteria bacterium]|nr:fluoride efflux transporter CrcB [Gammaproteobacteria bacterium]MXY58197.1 fluoride efflux transporter CrcB [Gammaproteobacteria bacterium]MYF30683.1 fluoride efflux transporter CrcB [Gammaproteobacteria bacterium]MYK46071.1 fluoride efflux transporter CrcB [Gammaproteobacteria bacterium]
MKTILWVAAGGACGAVLRYCVQAMASGTEFPWGTLLVNIAGCLAIGLAIGCFAGATWFETVGRPLLVAGVLGGFTTFSAFSVDTVLLWEQRRVVAAVAYVVSSVACCLLAAAVGYRVAGALA